jgi:acyl carrier protein
LRGYRIELGEIESALAGAPRVKEAVVEVRQDGRGEKRLVAYVVSEGERAGGRELRRYLAERLPEYMAPSVYVEMDQLPLTANGKIDRRRLPEPEAESGESRYVEPGSEVERVVAEIWAEALGVERVGVEDDFFELGGHSLMAARVLARVMEAFHIEVPLREVYQRPTVANMARLIEATYDSQRDEMDELASVLDQLEGLAQEEVDALLRQMAVTG